MKEKKFMAFVVALIIVYITSITATASITKNIAIDDSQKTIKTKKIIEKEIIKENKVKKAIIQKAISPKYEFIVKTTKVHVSPNAKSKILVTLVSSSRVKFLATKNVETTKKKKIKKKDGKVGIVITPTFEKWSKIEYTKNLTKNIGWVKSDVLNKDRKKSLPKYLQKIDYSENKKPNFKDNPRRDDIRGVYVSIPAASSPKFLNSLIALTKKSDINAFVIDVKDDNGNLLFRTDTEKKYMGKSKKYYPIKDIDKFIKKLKDNHIYLIARIVSFKSPRYSKRYQDEIITTKADGKPYTKKDKIIWVTPYSRNLWKYNMEIAKEAAKIGFNEIQFDYVRFPASNGGKLDKKLDYKNIYGETKPIAIQKYLQYARKELTPYNVYISADVFGQIGSLYDDMGLGQYWEAIANSIDYISPMAYPSHYGRGVYGLKNPDANPYKTVYHSTLDGINRNQNIGTPADIRPWIQAFTATWQKEHIKYGKKELNEQIKALKDLGINQYLLWNAKNTYKMAEK